MSVRGEEDQVSVQGSAQGSAVSRIIDWSPSQESLLRSWADKAACYRWMHDRSERTYRRLNYIMTVPIICLTTFTGTANFGMDSMFPGMSASSANQIVGALALLAGLITTLSNWLRVPQLMEAHRQASLHWGKLSRDISIEIGFRRDQRGNCYEFIKRMKQEMDRLIEQSPTVPTGTLNAFIKLFGAQSGLSQPENTNRIEPAAVCQDPVPVEEEPHSRVTIVQPSAGQASKPAATAPPPSPSNVAAVHADAVHIRVPGRPDTVLLN